MKIIRLVVIANLVFCFVMGCSEKKGHLITQSPAESKGTQKDLIDNWSDYHITYRFDANVIVFDPKNDDRKILAGGKGGGVWVAVQDSKGWEKFVEENITSDGEMIRHRYPSRETIVREIWGPDNQLYGFVIHPQGDGVPTNLVADNTLRVRYRRTTIGGIP